jgi:hypothetical protein
MKNPLTTLSAPPKIRMFRPDDGVRLRENRPAEKANAQGYSH